MIRRIAKSEFPVYLQSLEISVRNILPILGFAPNEIDQFMNEVALKQERRNNNISWLFENDAGQKAFIGGQIEYIIPSDWNDRYRIIKETINQLKTQISEGGRSHGMSIEINEMVPSHSAYFTALLPELGFRTSPQITFRAEKSLVAQLELPELPIGFYDIPFNEENRRLFTEGFMEIGGNMLSNEQAERRGRFLNDYYELISEDIQKKTWVGISRQNRVIGFCFGDVLNRGKRLAIAEVAVSQDFWGRGLGRFMIIRCLQNLKKHYGQKDAYFAIEARRDNARACRLYFGLGFKREQLTTRAIYDHKKQ
ncbi:MAG: GNAT family N-acetyltransferase [Candidatus Latescibacteria bacterium]|jgi:ribosomal protein S18 acetylase RimI-like enzyme|nr:GNAT family N-acetyltransferase [Candidatus Latescibacterota bacterium]